MRIRGAFITNMSVCVETELSAYIYLKVLIKHMNVCIIKRNVFVSERSINTPVLASIK